MRYEVEIEEVITFKIIHFFKTDSGNIHDAAQDAFNQYHNTDRTRENYDAEPDFRITSIKEVA
jgi:hypothetical protein